MGSFTWSKQVANGVFCQKNTHHGKRFIVFISVYKRATDKGRWEKQHSRVFVLMQTIVKPWRNLWKRVWKKRYRSLLVLPPVALSFLKDGLRRALCLGHVKRRSKDYYIAIKSAETNVMIAHSMILIRRLDSLWRQVLNQYQKSATSHWLKQSSHSWNSI